MNTQSSNFPGHREADKALVDCQVVRRYTFQLYYTQSVTTKNSLGW